MTLCRRINKDHFLLINEKVMTVKRNQVFIENENSIWEVAGVGIRRKIMAYGDAAMGVYVEFKKGAKGVLHHHAHVQVSFIHSGAFEVQIGGMKKVLRAGDFFYTPPNVEHGVVAIEAGVLIDFFTPAREDFLHQ